MRHRFLINNDSNKRLVVFFTGWSTDWRIIENINLPVGYDLMCCWDYRDIVWTGPDKQYDEAIIMAWSFGIPVATKLVNIIGNCLNVTGMFAICGSINPIDNENGIPEETFDATLNSLAETSLKKFRIRISGGLKRYLDIEDSLQTELSLENLKTELEKFSSSAGIFNNPVETNPWDYAFISMNDKIFPYENLLKSWKNTPIWVMNDSEHIPDFQSIFNLTIKDKEAIARNFRKSQISYDNEASVQELLANRLMDVWKSYQPTVDNVLEIGCGSGILTKLIISNFSPENITLVDLNPYSPVNNVNYICGDTEVQIRTLPDEKFDAVASSSTLQWLHSPRRFLRNIFRILKPGGICALSTFIEGTYDELARISGQSLLYLTEEQLKNISTNVGFEILNVESIEAPLYFSSFDEIGTHMKATGVNSLTGNKKTVGEIRRIMTGYPRTESGLFRLTYKACIIILKKLQ